MPAETQIGPFAIERELGRGGMGVVYAAQHQGRRVALKISLDDVSPRDRKNFLQEAELLARISHPGVIEILDSGTLEDGRPYLVMPLLEGETLGDRLKRGRMDADLALRLFAQLAAAVASLHEAGIVHRDIKPENVMYVEDEERLVLLDFGIARDLDGPAGTTTRLHMVRGTPGCMAPERFFGMRASAASDVYELAVVLYAMVVGQLPWDEPTDPEARLRPRHPSELGVDLPVGLGHILLEALSSRPDRRPSARELAVKVRAVEGAPLTPGSAPGRRTTVSLPAQPAVGLGETPHTPPQATPPAVAPWTPATPRPADVPRALTVPPPSDEKVSPPRRMPAAVWAVGAVLATSLAVGGAFWARARRVPVGGLVAARSGLGRVALAITVRPDASSAPAAGAAPPAVTVAAPESGPSTEPSPKPTASPAPAPAAATTAAPAAVAPGVPWCAKMVDLYCTPAARKLPNGDAICAEKRASLAKTAALPDSTRARAEQQCRDAIPAIEKSIRQPQASGSPEDMPWCKRVAAAYCTPEVKNSAGGDQLCAQGAANFYTRYLSLPPADRIAQNDRCAQVHPGVVSAMQQHVRDMGPGTAGSARYAAAFGPKPPATPATTAPAPPPGGPAPVRSPTPTAPATGP